MSERRSLGTDAWGTMDEFVHFDEDGSTKIVTQGDNTEFDEYRKLRRNDGSNGFWASRDFREVGSFAPVEWLMIANLYGVAPGSTEHDEVCLRVLRDPDFKNLRTTSTDGIPTKLKKH